MKVLVTGASGFLGRALVGRLLARGQGDVRCLVQATSPRDYLKSLAKQYSNACVEIFEGSLDRVADAARALHDVGLVFHLAARMTGSPDEISQGTVVTSTNLLGAMSGRAPAPQVVLASSFAVYGVGGLRRGALVDESTPIERHPEQRDYYSQAKLEQERMFWDHQRRFGFPLVVVRPGVIYGPGGTPISNRVGLTVGNVFLSLGGANLLPLTYVDNCAEAIALVGERPEAAGQIYNVVDDDLPTCRAYLRRYRAEVERIPSIPVPYPVLVGFSRIRQRNLHALRGRIPAAFNPVMIAATWRGNRFTNAKLKALGWKPEVSTEEGLRRTFQALRNARQL